VLWAEMMKRVLAEDVCVCRSCVGGTNHPPHIIPSVPSYGEGVDGAGWRGVGSRSA
jgi:hypothetical protein